MRHGTSSPFSWGSQRSRPGATLLHFTVDCIQAEREQQLGRWTLPRWVRYLESLWFINMLMLWSFQSACIPCYCLFQESVFPQVLSNLQTYCSLTNRVFFFKSNFIKLGKVSIRRASMQRFWSRLFCFGLSYKSALSMSFVIASECQMMPQTLVEMSHAVSEFGALL